ncbi:flagellar assembly factor FliW [Desulfatibacillum alkenivorans DSM 16219]|jgi:flagellar assembly factor FliW|uniref:Flagellar assembly factor FliW n=2 Tax=Desulfatibacillum alkenivorans TaxID=259354 RepID=A0A1M6HLL6_9BACT|nr:flagellar assembly factor FliW [Desulfatibacillum alkenivorans DSM 16219]
MVQPQESAITDGRDMTVKIETTRFGTLEVTEDKIISMPSGMIGFGEYKRFIIVQHNADSPFFWYQAVDEPGLAFVLTNPNYFMPEYQAPPSVVKRETGWEGDLADSEDLELYVTVRIPPDDPENMTANLIGPIVVNNKTMEAVQLVIAKSKYSHRHKILKKE